MSLYDDNGMINSDIQDALSELGNVGVGMATVALGKLLGMRVVIEPPRVMLVKNDILEALKLEPEHVAVGILMTMEHSLGGTVLFIVEKEFVIKAIQTMTGTQSEDVELFDDEDNLSAIQELANIMAASCVKAFADYSKIRVYLSPVMVGLDMVGALIAFPLAQFELNSERAISIDTRFSLSEKDGTTIQNAGHIIIMPDEESVERLVAAIGM